MALSGVRWSAGASDQTGRYRPAPIRRIARRRLLPVPAENPAIAVGLLRRAAPEDGIGVETTKHVSEPIDVSGRDELAVDAWGDDLKWTALGTRDDCEPLPCLPRQPCPNGSGIVDACTRTSMRASSAQRRSETREIRRDPRFQARLTNVDESGGIPLVLVTEHGGPDNYRPLFAVREGARECPQEDILTLPRRQASDDPEHRRALSCASACMAGARLASLARRRARRRPSRCPESPKRRLASSRCSRSRVLK